MQVCLGGTCTNIRELLILQSEASLSKLEAFPRFHVPTGTTRFHNPTR